VDKFVDTRASGYWDTQSRKPLEYGDVIESCASKTRGRLGKVDPGVFEDRLNIR